MDVGGCDVVNADGTGGRSRPVADQEIENVDPEVFRQGWIPGYLFIIGLTVQKDCTKPKLHTCINVRPERIS